MRLLIVTFHEITINYESELVLLNISANHNLRLPRSLQLNFLSNNLSVKDVYYVMKNFHLFSWLLNYDLSKISTKLVVSLIHNTIVAKFLGMLLDNDVNFLHTHIR